MCRIFRRVLCNDVYVALPLYLAQSQRLYQVPLPRDHQNISNSPASVRSEANTLQHTRLRCKVLTPDKVKDKFHLRKSLLQWHEDERRNAGEDGGKLARDSFFFYCLSY
ncbi:hypothetical protein FVEG_03810 [Fusarium verticillioides 7600]|uniref:Uncharacterized protein n=1 Tax=Gibberella moniliformis (strain M3125 / FGSC 7600) TaxID=334819 RepID=W7MA43_GIBM7|nr:hypothetical protein FVEG_03810 [Fusarium verticillioides 7600]EWG41787.1 hypothetical protein FVEG_03810 [Fusarium verticillioides 7600]